MKTLNKMQRPSERGIEIMMEARRELREKLDSLTNADLPISVYFKYDEMCDAILEGEITRAVWNCGEHLFLIDTIATENKESRRYKIGRGMGAKGRIVGIKQPTNKQ